MMERKQTTEATGTPPKAPAVGSQVDLVLGPLPEGREYIAGMNRHFAKVCGTVTAYSAEDMRAYAAQEVAAERERCAKLVETQDANGDYGMQSWFDLLAANIRA